MRRHARMHPRARILKLIRGLEETLNDKRWWNRNRHDAAPFDLGVDLIALRSARRMLAAWDRGDHVGVERHWSVVRETLEHPV